VVVVLPVIIGYTVFAYRVFWGKSIQLRYWFWKTEMAYTNKFKI
jgi:hypothetical protein